jgi:hypothetical protein
MAKSFKPGNAMRIRIDDLMRKTLREKYKRTCPILGSLGRRYLAPSKKSGYPFERFLADTPKGFVAVFVSGLHNGEPKVTIAPAVRSTFTVKRLLGVLDRRKARKRTGIPIVQFDAKLPVLPQ